MGWGWPSPGSAAKRAAQLCCCSRRVATGGGSLGVGLADESKPCRLLIVVNDRGVVGDVHLQRRAARGGHRLYTIEGGRGRWI